MVMLILNQNLMTWLVILLLWIAPAAERWFVSVPWVEQSNSVSFDDAFIVALEYWDTVEAVDL